MLVEALIQAVIYTTTAIATLRAGSRAIYAQNHGQIGIMDGPLILSPQDIAQLREQGSMEGEVSPLWEPTYGFTEAVKLLYHETQFPDDIVVGNWRKEEETNSFYSMASPHKAYVEVKLKADKEEINEQNTTQPRSTMDETSLILMKPKQINKWGEPKTLSLIRNYISKKANKLFERTEAMMSLCWEIMDCHPLLGGKYDFPPSRTNDVEEEEIDGDDDNVDLDLFYATTIKMPKTDFGDVLLNKEICPNDGIDREARIKSYASKTFAKLRSRFGISEEDFLASLTKSGPNISFQSNSKGAARVGGFFFFSRDGAYMVKTIKKAEIKAILEMLPKYYKFMKRNASRSLLTRFCGLYSVKIGNAGVGGKDEEERCFLIMNSVFPAESSQFISERFDLKGSTIGRECSLEEKESKGSHAVLKDNDLLNEVEIMRFKIPDCGISIGPTAKAALLSQLRKDLGLLVECGVMDYSLLVGVVNMDVVGKSYQHAAAKDKIEDLLRTNKPAKKGKVFNNILSALYTPVEQLQAPAATICQTAFHGIRSTVSTVLTYPFPYYGAGACGVDGGSLSIMSGKRLGKRAVYYLGVIDFLQPWTTQKVLENQIKGALGYDKSAISCVDPKEYAERFLKFMDKVIT